VEVAAGTFSDPYNHGLSYQATLSSGAALPSGLTWSGTSFNVGALAAGSYTIKVIATDGLGRTASANFTLTVNNVAPTLAAPSNLTAVQGSAMTAYTAPSATDANGDAITYSASNLPPGISFNAATRAFSGTPTGTGTWTVTYTATDSHGAATSKTFTITVSPPANQPPVYNGGIPSDIFFSPGSLSYTFPATAFTSPAGLALTYTATTPLYIHFDAGTRTFTATQARAERFGTVTLTATDSQGRATSYTFSVDVLGTANNLMAAPDMGSLSSSASSTDEASTSFAPSASPQTVQAQTEATGTTPNTQSYWFTYDADNRVVVSNGALSNGQIVITAGGYNEPSYANQYDAAGNVVVRNTLNADTYSIQAAYVTKTYTAGDVMTQRLVYDARNEQVEVDYATDLTQSESSLGVQQHLYYDADGHQTGTNNFARNDAYVAVYGTHDMPNGYTYVPIGGWLQFGDATSYNADGAVTEQVSFQAPYRDWLQIANAWNNTGNLPGGGADAVPSITGDGPLVVHSTTTYTAFDHAGNVTAYSYAQNPPPSGGGSAFGADYTVSYLKKDGYLEQSTTGTATVQGYIPATDTSYYDAFGQRTAVSQTSQGTSGAKDDTRLFAYDTRGEILERRRGTVSNDTFTAYSDSTIDHYAYVDGQQIGSLDEGGGIHVLGSLTGFSSGASRQSYVVQAGDTLAGIAQAVYGNSQYGYLVAEANGLGGDSDLVVGQAIALPSITTSSNAANTFKPYDPGQIVGSTTPSLPMVPPPPRVQCQTLSRVIAIVVQVIVSYYSGNPGAGAAAGNLAGQYSSMMFNNQFDWGRAARFAVNPFSGSASDFARTIYDPPAAGAPGKADYKSAAIAGAAAEAGYGAGYLAAPLGNTASLMISAGAQYTTSVELSKMAGYDTSFSWRELGTSMATAYAGAKIADAVGAGPIESRDAKTGATVWKPQPFSWGLLVRQATADVLTQGANYVMRKAAGLSARWDWQDVGADVFGNALGNALVGEIKASRDRQAPDHVNTLLPVDIAAPTWHVDDIHVQMPPLGPVSYTVQAGDTLSTILGTSDPAAIGAFMRANGLSDSTIHPGDQLVLPSGGYDQSDAALGQVTLDHDNAMIMARASQSGVFVGFENASASPVLIYGGETERSMTGATGSMRYALPAIEEPAFVQPGYFEQAHAIALQGYSDPRNSMLERGAFLVLAGLEEPMNLFASAVRGIANVGPYASIAAQNFAAASLIDDPVDRLTYIGNGLGAGGSSLLGLTGAAGLLGSVTADTALEVNGSINWGIMGPGAKGGADSTDLVDPSVIEQVRTLPKGARPDPVTYLSPSYIDKKLSNFDQGASYLVPKDILDEYGRDILGMPDNSQYVIPSTQMDSLLTKANGDISVIESELGIPSGQWQGRSLIRIDVSSPGELNLRIPSGNEMGANDLWIPGGTLRTGYHEGVINNIPYGKYQEVPAWH